MNVPDSDARTWPTGLVLLVTAVVAGAGFLALPDRGRPRVLMAEGLVAAACVVAAWVIGVVRTQGRAWKGAGFLAMALLLVAAAVVAYLLFGVADRWRPHASAADVAFLVFAVPILLAVREEFRTHFPPERRLEMWVDVTLVTVSLTVISYVWLRPA